VDDEADDVSPSSEEGGVGPPTSNQSELVLGSFESPTVTSVSIAPRMVEVNVYVGGGRKFCRWYSSLLFAATLKILVKIEHPYIPPDARWCTFSSIL